MKVIKKIVLSISFLILFFSIGLTSAHAQFLYPFYGYGYAYVPYVPLYANTFSYAGPPTDTAAPQYRSAQALLTTLALLGVLPTTTSSLLSYTTPTYSPLTTTSSTLGITTALLLGGGSSSITTALLLASTPTTLYPSTSSTLGITTALLLGGTSTTTLLTLGLI